MSCVLSTCSSPELRLQLPEWSLSNMLILSKRTCTRYTSALGPGAVLNSETTTNEHKKVKIVPELMAKCIHAAVWKLEQGAGMALFGWVILPWQLEFFAVYHMLTKGCEICASIGLGVIFSE